MAIARAMANETTGTPAPQRAIGWVNKVRDYVQDLNMEMRRVSWPNWKQVRATTLVVIIAVFAFAAYFWVVDFIVGRGITRIFTAFSR